jgi:hypothetical protein
MMEMKVIIILFFGFIYLPLLNSQDRDRKIQFPDVEGYKTLKVDLHIHTVFSDGKVWPNIRVLEAVKDGLDAISLTEHLEYQPHKEDIPNPDRNRSYEIAREIAKPYDLLVIHGAEITRSMPPGHANALFISDANELIHEDAMDAYKKARSQGAFIFWNHPNWINQQKDAIPFLSDFHKELIKNDLLHGIEVVNDITYSEDGVRTAIENNLTLIGTSDIHGLVDYQFEIAEGGHRPITLLFATEKSEEAIKEALFGGRTVTWFDNNLTGTQENMKLLMDASLNFVSKGYIGSSEVLELEVTNSSDASFMLQNKSDFTFYKNSDLIEIQPHSTSIINVIMSKKTTQNAELIFDVLNAVVGYKKCFQIKVIVD